MIKNSNKLWMILIMITLFFVSCDIQQPTEIVPSASVSEQNWDFNPVIEFEGFVVPENDTYLSFQRPGHIHELNVQVGGIVQSGDLIAVLDSTTIQSEIAKAEADLELAKAELEKSKLGSHPALIKEAESKVELARAERPIGVEEESAKIANVNSALARLEYLKALPIPEDIKLAEAEVVRREVALEAARLSLNQTFLISPIEGNVVEIYIKEYEYAGIGEPIVRISNLKNLQVDVVVDSFEIGNIKLGDNATIRFDVIPNLEILGEVIFIRPEDLDRMSGNFIVTLSLLDQPEEISLGMMAYVNFSE